MHQIGKDITGAGKTELQLLITAPIDRVFRTLTDVEHWPDISDLYEFAHWTSRRPWEVGSTFEAKITWPFPLTLAYVVAAYRPQSEVRWLVHGIGAVIERWTRFSARGRQTEITSSALYFRTTTRELPHEVGDLLAQFTHRFYSGLKAACEAKAA
jgi:hypothetical protein